MLPLILLGNSLPAGEQVGHQVGEFVGGDDFGDVGGHEGEGGLLLLVDVGFGEGEFLALSVGEDELGAFFAADEAGEDAAVGEAERGGAEGDIDVAVGVEDVFEQAVEAAVADAVELRADERAFVGDLVAGGAVLFIDGLAALEVCCWPGRRRGGGR